jgi:hypothetical protein
MWDGPEGRSTVWRLGQSGDSGEPIITIQRDLAVEACAGHTNSFRSNDATVGTCCDADRLDIGRVGVVVNPSFMSTQAACDPVILAWAQERSEYRRVPDFAVRYL